MDKNWPEVIIHGNDNIIILDGVRYECSNASLFRQVTPNWLLHPDSPFATLDRVLKKAVELNLAQ